MSNTPKPIPAKVRQRIVDLAFEANEVLGEMCHEHRAQFTRDQMRDAEVAWCVWPDEREENTFHGMRVKGDHVPSGEQDTIALLVPDRRIAELVHATLGDGAPAVTHSAPEAIQ
jgi:hypothetical protein